MSNIATIGRGKTNRRQQKPSRSEQLSDSDNSVDTELRESEDRRQAGNDEDSVQTGSDVSELSGHWDGKENHIDNHVEVQRWGDKGRAIRPKTHPVASGFSSESDISSIRRSNEVLHTAQRADFRRGQGNAVVAAPQQRPHQAGRTMSDTRGRQVARASGYSNYTPRSRSAPKKVHKLDVVDIFRQQKESFQPPPAKEHGRSILGPEAMTRWQIGVERAALNSHRNLSRSVAGIV